MASWLCYLFIFLSKQRDYVMGSKSPWIFIGPRLHTKQCGWVCLFFHLSFLSSSPIPQKSQLWKPGWKEQVNVWSHWTKGLLEALPKLRGMSLRQGTRDQEKVWEDKCPIVLPHRSLCTCLKSFLRSPFLERPLHPPIQFISITSLPFDSFSSLPSLDKHCGDWEVSLVLSNLYLFSKVCPESHFSPFPFGRQSQEVWRLILVPWHTFLLRQSL